MTLNLLLRRCSNQVFMGRMMSQKIYEPTDIEEPPLPKPKIREGETSDVKRARLLYQSRKRGMAENGILLSTFASEFLNKLNDVQLKQYDMLINIPSNDWEIYYWMVGTKPTPPEYDNEVMDMLKKHAQNVNMESRIIQPELKSV